MIFIVSVGVLFILIVMVCCLAFYQSAIAAGKKADKRVYAAVAVVLSVLIGVVYYKGPMHDPMNKREGIRLVKSHYKAQGCKEVAIVSSSRQTQYNFFEKRADYYFYHAKACGNDQMFLYDAMADKLYPTD
ncbi:hypothetical protein [Paenibacillus sp. MBLB4367]|uniref:hypothetical protein n=1 Tax=Paenibacillus sp. MBLB4367 TaxID=3384767 RepID=UPI0039083033